MLNMLDIIFLNIKTCKELNLIQIIHVTETFTLELFFMEVDDFEICPAVSEDICSKTMCKSAASEKTGILICRHEYHCCK